MRSLNDSLHGSGLSEVLDDSVSPIVLSQADGDARLIDIPTQQESANSLAVNVSVSRDVPSMIGGLSSAMIHMVLLITLGLLFASIRVDESVEIEMSFATVSADDPLDTFTLANDLLDKEDVEQDFNAEIVSDLETEFDVSEPTLTDLAVVDVGAASDVASALASAVNASSGGAQADSAKKGEFFGASAYGDEFVYVVDMSTSMNRSSKYGRSRFQVACEELLSSVGKLNADQKFCVIMFCYQTRFMFDQRPKLISATNANKRKLAQWVAMLQPSGGTDPRFGIVKGLALKPDAMFLLSDGEFNGRSVNAHGILGNVSAERLIEKHRKGVTPIHTIAFEDLNNRRRLRKISESTNGHHHFVGRLTNQQLLMRELQRGRADDVMYAMGQIVDGKLILSNREKIEVGTRVARMLTANSEAMRELSLDCLRTLSDGEDFGPSDEDDSAQAYGEAQRRWLEYWSDRRIESI